jgi:hypothetical protein
MPDFLKITLPLIGAVVAWFVNQWQQRSRDDYLRKEKLYRDLLDAIQGFYDKPSGPVPTSTVLQQSGGRTTGMQTFLDQARLAWLYSPDEVILSAYTFLDTVNVDRLPPSTKPEREMAFGNVIAAVRGDLFRPRFFFWQRTNLTGAQYRHLEVKVK